MMSIRIKFAAALGAAVLLTLPGLAENAKPLLLRQPSINATTVVFAFAGDLWTAPRDGGVAGRLTAGVGIESSPLFSPDGSFVAFTGQYDGNIDVYVVPASGGIPVRLTHHPDADTAVGWTPDGARILFTSSRTSFSGVSRLFTVPPRGGFPEELALPTAVQASYASDARRLAYVPTMQWQREWKRYKGGQTTPIWIVDLADLKVEKVPRVNSNDFNPMWIGDKVYFLSDRNGAVSLFAYDLTGKTVAEALPNRGFDFKSASAGPGGG